MSLEEINSLRTRAAILMPHEEMNRSASEPVEIPAGDVFGPYGGQILLPDNNGKRITRLMLEKVGDTWQGACALFYNENGLQLGNNRVVFSPDKKTLYVGQTSRGWGQIAEGLQRITYTGKTPFDIVSMSLTETGFRLKFTKAIASDAGIPEHFSMRRYRYEDTGSYGSDKLDVSDIKITKVEKIDEQTLALDIDTLEGGSWVYELTVKDLVDSDGASLHTGLFCYTVNQLLK